MGITESGPVGQAKGQEACAQAKEARAGNLERVQECSPVVQGWGQKAKVKLELDLAKDAKNNCKRFYGWVGTFYKSMQ